MMPWLIIAGLVGLVVGLISGTFIASSLLQRYSHHVQSTQTQPQPHYPRVQTRYLDDDEYMRRPRR